jgi:lambda repressor-like predicted transcriptional regulator
VTLDPSGPDEAEIKRRLEAAAITVRNISLQTGSGIRTLTLNVSKPRRRSEAAIPAVLKELSRQAGVSAIEWRSFD